MARESSWRASELAIRFWDEEMRIRVGEEGFFLACLHLWFGIVFFVGEYINQYINHVGCACHKKKSTDLICISQTALDFFFSLSSCHGYSGPGRNNRMFVV